MLSSGCLISVAFLALMIDVAHGHVNGTNSSGNGTSTNTLSTGGLIVATLRALGTASTMALVGFIAARKGLVTPAISKGLANISMNFTIPALLFTSILDCTQDWSTSKCPDIRETMKVGWQLALLPFWYVAAGWVLGSVMTRICRTPPEFQKAAVVACAFGNSTGLPITLLAVIHQSFSPHTELGGVNPVLYLSVYLLIYPIIQWGLGGWMLGLNQAKVEPTKTTNGREPLLTEEVASLNSEGEQPPAPAAPCTNLALNFVKNALNALNPPVIASIVGLVISFCPLPSVLSESGNMRGLFVDTDDRDDDAPLEWMFDGLRNVAAAAVPINMIILGSSLAKGADLKKVHMLSNGGIVLVKMVLMPMIGVATAFATKHFFDIPDPNDGPFYLVLLIVTCTPTANNCVVMCDVAGQDKTALSAAIFTQYVCAPLLLCASVSLFVGLATGPLD